MPTDLVQTNIYTQQLDNIADEAILTPQDQHNLGMLVPDHIHHTTIGGTCLRCHQPATNGAWAL